MTQTSEKIFRLYQGFNDYFLKTLKPALEEKEKIRKKYLSKFYLLLTLSLVIIPILTLVLFESEKIFGVEVDSGPFFMVIALVIFILQRPYHSYKKEVKNDIMQLMADYFEGFKYLQNNGFSIEELEETLLFKKADIYSSDDSFEGNFENVSVKIAEELLQNIHYTKRGRRTVTVFQGMLIRFKMNKNFQGQTIVLKDAGFLNRFKKFSGLEHVTLEDPNFEKKFEVYSSNQVEARYLLTPLFMERIEKLKNLYEGRSIELSFLDNHVLIAVQTDMDMFEPLSFFKSNINEKKIKRVFEQFLNIFSMIEILNLSEKTGI